MAMPTTPRFQALLLVLALMLVALGMRPNAAAERLGAPSPAVELGINGAIGPATADYIGRGLEDAAKRGAPLVLLRIDTPGGLDTSMRAIIQAILASPTPVVAYVAPSGARAASAGTFIVYASHVAAMAPGTNVGAATPVSIGGGLPGGGKGDDSTGEGAGKQQDGDSAARARSPSEAKAVNDAVAYLRSLAELRGRNAQWPERAVREGASLSAQQALEGGVIDIIARDRKALFDEIDGRRVTAGGRDIELKTKGLAVETVVPGWRTQLLSAITDPNVALILMMIGMYGLLFEFMNPGAVYPGTIGAICLLTALYAFSALPVTYAGAGLLLLGLGLMIGEAFAPSFGVLGIGGALAFALGAALLIDADVPAFRIAWQVIAGLTIVSLAVVIVAVRAALRSRRRGVVSGREQMVGARGVVQDWSGRHGHVFVHGERWNAVGNAPMVPGAEVRVTALNGLLLHVEPEPPHAYTT